MADQPSWRQGFDALEKQVAPRLESMVQSEQFAVAVGLAARAQRAVEGELARTTRRVLHRLNLPAGSDVSRILNEIGQLRVQVRALSEELDEARAELASRPPAEVTTMTRKAPAKRRPAKPTKKTGAA
jgi:exopolyphosphatase/pppGpp-phosphohydrolase